MEMKKYTCYMCKKEFFSDSKATYYSSLKKGRAYCSIDCSKKSSSIQSSIRMAITNKKYASERMKKNNPMSRPEIREKMRLTSIRIGNRPQKRGGNGKGPTKYQLILATAIGWDMEHIINTGALKDKYKAPNHYKIDIANPELKIAIEVDGNSHNTIKGQDRDERKDAFLKEIGWKIIRFKNQEIKNNLKECIQRIKDEL